MTTIFTAAAFRRFDLGSHARLTPAGHPRMAQMMPGRQYDFSVISDILKDVGVSESEITDLLNKIPSDAAGPYRAQLEDCKRKGLTTAEGAQCAIALYEAIKSGKPVTPMVAPPPMVQQPSSFPVVPVVLAVGAAGALIYFLTKKG